MIDRSQSIIAVLQMSTIFCILYSFFDFTICLVHGYRSACQARSSKYPLKQVDHGGSIPGAARLDAHYSWPIEYSDPFQCQRQHVVANFTPAEYWHITRKMLWWYWTSQGRSPRRAFAAQNICLSLLGHTDKLQRVTKTDSTAGAATWILFISKHNSLRGTKSDILFIFSHRFLPWLYMTVRQRRSKSRVLHPVDELPSQVDAIHLHEILVIRRQRPVFISSPVWR